MFARSLAFVSSCREKEGWQESGQMWGLQVVEVGAEGSEGQRIPRCV